MPVYLGLQCASDACSMFSVQQEKKSNQWKCAVCGLKQSVRKVYARAEKAKEVRPIVQELNMRRGQAQELVDAAKKDREARATEQELQHFFDAQAMGGGMPEMPHAFSDTGATQTRIPSRWDAYVQQPSAGDENEEDADEDEIVDGVVYSLDSDKWAKATKKSHGRQRAKGRRSKRKWDADAEIEEAAETPPRPRAVAAPKRQMVQTHTQEDKDILYESLDTPSEWDVYKEEVAEDDNTTTQTTHDTLFQGLLNVDGSDPWLATMGMRSNPSVASSTGSWNQPREPAENTLDHRTTTKKNKKTKSRWSSYLPSSDNSEAQGAQEDEDNAEESVWTSPEAFLAAQAQGIAQSHAAASSSSASWT